jgi:tetratricopeptide (TPR) repeat protein
MLKKIMLPPFIPIEFILFVASFALYTFTCGPYVVPYRDAGEMVTVISTLGVAHPPGYPLYALIGKIALLLPAGSVFYRANIFSALCAAGAIVVLFAVLRRLLSAPAAFASVAALALSNLFWELASVSEMYTLGVLWFGLLLWAAFVEEDAALWAFLMGLALGVRMDMLLLIPLFALWFWSRGQKMDRAPLAALAFGAGMSLFLFLLIRTRTDPMMDWGNPDTLLGVFRSATRKSYSGTLDLLSLSYHAGENFAVNLQLYAEHVFHAFGVAGGILAVGGFASSFKRQRALTLWCLAVFAITGPVFLFLANMPPNPHAIAIVEAAYLIPDVIVALGIGFAVQSALLWKRPVGQSVLAVALVSVAINAPSAFTRADKRNNFYACDYVANVLRSLPRDSVAVFHKDVQVFSLWAAQLVEGRRPDAAILSTGLSASAWFWEMHRRWNTALCPELPLTAAADWGNMAAALGPRPFLMGYDVDFPANAGIKIFPHGYVAKLAGSEASFDDNSARIFSMFGLNRGRGVYGETPDFFSTDLIGDAALAQHQTGVSALAHNLLPLAAFYFNWAAFTDPTMPRASSDAAYIYFVGHDYAAAEAYYQRALRKAQARLALAKKYKSLPDILNACLSDVSSALTQVGASAERLGRLDEARAAYERSLSVQENAQAHYNLAVTYWNKDWPLVISHMRRALELDPQMNDARMYLAKAMEHSAQK